MGSHWYLYRVHVANQFLGPEMCLLNPFELAPPPPPQFINKPPFIPATGAAIYGLFRDKKTNDEGGSSSVSPPRSTGTTPQPYPSSSHDIYSRGQTNTRVPATPDTHHDSYQLSSRTPTHANDTHWPSSTTTHTQPSYLQPLGSTRIARAAAKTKANRTTRGHGYQTREALRTSARTHASYPPQLYYIRLAQADDSPSQTPSTSTCAQASYHQPLSQSRVTEATAKTQASFTTSRYDDYGHRSSLASSRVTESRETSAASAARTHVSNPPQLTSTHVSQSVVNTTSTADHSYGIHPSGLAPPYSKESPLTGLVPSHMRISYHRAPSPDASRLHVLGYSDSDTSPTHSRIRTSSSGSDYLGPTSSTQRVPSSPSPGTNTQLGVGFDSAAANPEDMKAAIALRERARRSNREMREARDLAKSTRKRGDYSAEQMHRQEAIAHESEMKSLNKRAAKIIFRENNKALTRGTVDLHGLYIPEALEYAKKELQSAVYRSDDEICFIIGKGLHSDGGLSKLRPRLAELCDERRLRHSLDPKNAGKLIVQMIC